ncbi:MAG: DNA repair and recombination protein RadB [Candidatus Woesearchaeota archaeon]
METKISSGSDVMDWLLEGGYEKDSITTIYGPAGSGKTNLCLVCIAKSVKDKKILYIDTDGSFSISRFKQICPNFKEALERVIFLNPTNYEEQKKAFSILRRTISDKFGLVVFDSVAMLYRIEVGKNQDIYKVNKELAVQIGLLSEIARKKNIPILITNQVYADFEDREKVNMVGGDLLKYQSKCIIELKKMGNGIREAIIRKHRSIEEGKTIKFKINDTGIVEIVE